MFIQISRSDIFVPCVCRLTLLAARRADKQWGLKRIVTGAKQWSALYPPCWLGPVGREAPEVQTGSLQLTAAAVTAPCPTATTSGERWEVKENKASFILLRFKRWIFDMFVCYIMFCYLCFCYMYFVFHIFFTCLYVLLWLVILTIWYFFYNPCSCHNLYSHSPCATLCIREIKHYGLLCFCSFDF